MKVLVTGGAGFIGSHLVEALLARGDEVQLLDNLDPVYDPGPRRARIPGAVRHVDGSLLDPGCLAAALAGCDAVAHLAARPGVRESLADPMTTTRINVDGTVALLDAMRHAGVRRLVFASSSSVYGVRRGSLLRESDPADRPASPYGASKRAGEIYAWAAHAAWGLDVSCTRLFTVFGPRQRPGMAIARFVRQLRAGEPVTLYGDGTTARDYTFVADAVTGLLAALDRAEGYHLVNLAGGVSVRLDVLVHTLADVLGVPLRIERLPEQPGDVPETAADLAIARDWLDYTPRVSLAEGLRRYVAWLDAGQP